MLAPPCNWLRTFLRPLEAMILAAVLAGPVAAEGERLAEVAKSPLIRKITEKGDWKISRAPDAIRLSCQGCDAQIEIEISADAVYDPDAPDAPFGLYVSRREAYCAALVRKGEGECLSTSQVGWRWMVGFRSVTAMVDGGREVEYIYFDTPAGLRARVYSVGNNAYTGAIEQLAEMAVVRMSSAW